MKSRLPRRKLSGVRLGGETDPVTAIGPFPAGVDQISPEVNLPPGTLRQAVNVDIDRTGWLRRRAGQTLFTAGQSCESLFSDANNIYWNDGATLYRSRTTQASPVAIGTMRGRISSCLVGESIYLTNGTDRGVITRGGYRENWWTAAPSSRVSAAPVSGGSLPMGDYFVTATLVGLGGKESGAPTGTRVRVAVGVNESHLTIHQPAAGAILVTGIPQAPGCHARLYATHAGDPETYYLAAIVMGGVTSWTITEDAQGPVLTTRHLTEMPPGQIVRYHRGRLYVAQGDVLHFSHGMNPGLYHPVNMWLQFEGRIKVVQPVTDGLFVVADQTWWLPDVDAEEMPRREMVYPASAVEGSGLTVPGHFFPEMPRGDVAYWFGDHGAVLGLPQGTVQPVQESRIAPDRAAHGSSLFRRENGITSVITTANNGVNNVARASDYISVEFKGNIYAN